MFLGVSVTLPNVDMTDEQRKRFGRMVRQTRMERYETKLAAYQDAGINSATWDRIENGQSVKSHTLTSVIKKLWPSAGGDWRNVPGLFDAGGDSIVGGLFDEVTEYDLKIERWVLELQERIELLEKHVYRKEGGSGGDTASNTPAGGSPALGEPKDGAGFEPPDGPPAAGASTPDPNARGQGGPA